MLNTTREFEVAIYVNGRPVTEVDHQGSTYIEGRNGTPYELFLCNNTSNRVLVIPSVDGLSVIDGKLAGIKSPGYILEAHSSLVVPGWKVDGQTAAKFVFRPSDEGKTTPGKQTYANELGVSQENQGTIGFMIFREKPKPSFDWSTDWFNEVNKQYPVNNPRPKPWINPPRFGGFVYQSDPLGNGIGMGQNSADTPLRAYSTTSSVSPVGGAVSASLNSVIEPQSLQDVEGLGTGWGKATDFKTTKGDFVRETPDTPNLVFAYFYDTLRGLKRKGVPVEKFTKKTPVVAPNPFPASPKVYDRTGCQPPKGWKK